MYYYFLVVQFIGQLNVQGAPVTVAPLQGSICTNPGKKICGFKTVPICEEGTQMHGVVWKSYWVQFLKLVMC